ncbi:hypothetical protein C0991_010700 [Blastosporella zonata]|nr:hypothetical protein C0991_010700 [Blastosporella zonata]
MEVFISTLPPARVQKPSKSAPPNTPLAPQLQTPTNTTNPDAGVKLLPPPLAHSPAPGSVGLEAPVSQLEPSMEDGYTSPSFYPSFGPLKQALESPQGALPSAKCVRLEAAAGLDEHLGVANGPLALDSSAAFQAPVLPPQPLTLPPAPPLAAQLPAKAESELHTYNPTTQAPPPIVHATRPSGAVLAYENDGRRAQYLDPHAWYPYSPHTMCPSPAPEETDS